MKVLSQLLGRYSNCNKPLILFRLPDTDTLFYRLSDIEPLFNLPSLSFKNASYKGCYRDHEDTYLNTTVLSEIAKQHNRHLLIELCKLKPDDYNVGLADAILQTFPQFKRAPKEEHIWESVQLPLENLEDIIENESTIKTIKTEPTSPPLINQIIPETRNAMALDKVLLNSNKSRRQSINESDRPNNKRQRIGAATSSPSNEISSTTSGTSNREKRQQSLSSINIGTNLIKQPRKVQSHPTTEIDKVQQQTSLPNDKKKSSSKHKNTLNLTIFAPSYHEQLTGIRSAPLNSNFGKSNPPQPQYNRSNYVNGSIPYNASIPPASATVNRPFYAHPPSLKKHEFAIPPIVPSQQQPPHSAHSTTNRENMAFQQYGHYYKQHPPTSVYNNHSQRQRTHEQIAATAANVPLPPKTPTTNSFAALQRQQYLQPFEHLFDTIETTRTLKSTLDDQIRRSSTLMQTLQASVTTIEGLVRNQVKEAQWEIVSQLERKIEGLLNRIEVIENRFAKKQQSENKVETKLSDRSNQHSIPSPLPSATKEERTVAEELIAFSERRRDNTIQQQQQQQSDDLQTPPTIVRSQNDIGPKEYQSMLNTLRDRLDRLERQIEA
ncbi:uncharacterized protein BX663DRAFT_507220 [Cokeromyces recurvatus]|uniref:uncharacterized protein n=1 Tax=Cokeromyces recurvatus TaxID=90255 RepID=UPI00221FD9C6|nr:uncharacterized protein BX663DRAFT_507220 [Cokeromyces recurvatus]KAI7903654.1 hypothetical protein BX663DRAFT_507220 [Cokeromyces recurvatus]